MRYLLTRHPELIRAFHDEYGSKYATLIQHVGGVSEARNLFRRGDIVFGVIPYYVQEILDQKRILYYRLVYDPRTGKLKGA